jgi:hypothetical protein
LKIESEIAPRRGGIQSREAIGSAAQAPLRSARTSQLLNNQCRGAIARGPVCAHTADVGSNLALLQRTDNEMADSVPSKSLCLPMSSMCAAEAIRNITVSKIVSSLSSLVAEPDSYSRGLFEHPTTRGLS